MLKELAAVAALLMAIFGSPSAHAATIWVEPRMVGLGGTLIYIKGKIFEGDEQRFASAAASAVPPVYVVPSGPGGATYPALAIGDIIAARGFSTIVGNFQCASACALIWASGYAHHAIAHNGSFIYFHSCASYGPGNSHGYDDIDCNRDVVQRLLRWGFTQTQAYWAVVTPHDTTPLLASQPLAASLGFRWQWLPNYPGHADHCAARICIVVP